MNKTQLENYLHNFEPEKGCFEILKRSSNNVWGGRSTRDYLS